MKNVGDKVQRDEPLFEISTDKVDAEIPAPASGILKEIRVQPGATVPINTVVGVIAAEGEAVAAATAASAAPPRAPSGALGQAIAPLLYVLRLRPCSVLAGRRYRRPGAAPGSVAAGSVAAGTGMPREPPRPAPSAAPPP